MLHALAKLWRTANGESEPEILDHVPVGGQNDLEEKDRMKRMAAHSEKLREAFARHGKAFACAGLNQEREVYVTPGLIRVAAAGGSATAKETLSAGDIEVGSWSVPAYEGNVERLSRRAARG